MWYLFAAIMDELCGLQFIIKLWMLKLRLIIIVWYYHMHCDLWDKVHKVMGSLYLLFFDITTDDICILKTLSVIAV